MNALDFGAHHSGDAQPPDPARADCVSGETVHKLGITRRLPPDWILPCEVVLAVAVFFSARSFDRLDLCRDPSRFACGRSACRFCGRRL